MHDSNGQNRKLSKSKTNNDNAYLPNNEVNMSQSSSGEDLVERRSSRKKLQNRSRSRSGQSTLSGRGNFNNKKRKIGEITNSYAQIKQTMKNELWILKYAPQSLDDVIVNKKKVAEFCALAGEKNLKILIVSGPSGAGKNSLINLYCKKHIITSLRFSDQKQNHLLDLYGERTGFQEGGDEQYPEDLENLLYFLRTNIKSKSATQGVCSNLSGGNAAKFSTFCKTKKNINDQQQQMYTYNMNTIEQEVGFRKILIINGLPECLKVFSKRKLQLIRDFQQVIEQILSGQEQNQPLCIFTFSEQNERSYNFLNKIFGSKAMGEGQEMQKLAILNINQPTDLQIEKILKNILEYEDITSLSKESIEQIRQQSNKDLRNAIQTLQFYCAGRCQGQSINTNKKIKLSSNLAYNQKRVLRDDDEDMIDSDNFLSQRSTIKDEKNKKKANDAFKTEKDNMYTIFHALGKFLYNKRINAQTGQIEQMPSKIMKNPESRPELYFKHLDILNQIQLEKPVFSLYLHENMLSFYNDIDDVAECLDVYSFTDNVTSSMTYSYSNIQFQMEMEELAALVVSIAITEFNVHGGDHKGQQKHIYQMQKPYYYDHLKDLKQNKLMLKDNTKENQIISGHLISEDMLIRSTKEILKNILPFLNQMSFYQKETKDLSSLVQFHKGKAGYRNGEQQQQYQTSGKNQKLFEDDAKDNSIQDQILEEMMMEKNRKNRWQTQKHKNASNSTSNDIAIKIDTISNFLPNGSFKQIQQNNVIQSNQQKENENEESLMDGLDGINDSDLDMLLGELSIEEDIEDVIDNDVVQERKETNIIKPRN